MWRIGRQIAARRSSAVRTTVWHNCICLPPTTAHFRSSTHRAFWILTKTNQTLERGYLEQKRANAPDFGRG
jgi:hypothetical protein